MGYTQAIWATLTYIHIYSNTDYRWPTKKETHAQGPPAAITSHYVEAGSKLREGRGEKALGEDVDKLEVEVRT
jgi:hypothetical protein